VLYAGDHWHAALSALELTRRFSARAELWVISAGYGLIPASAEIKPYSATFASGKDDSVWRGNSDGTRRQQLQGWWRALANGTTLSDLAATARDGALMLAAGASYLEAIAPDLEHAVDLAPERVSVISAGSRMLCGLLPVSSRFRARVGGTDSATNARVLSLLAADAPTHRFRPDLMAARLRRINSRLPAMHRATGRRVTDEEVSRAILRIRKAAPTISRSQALRTLRAGGIACEQSRFAAIWSST
jgi:hypothetical protein